jgi:hypothetical protein
LDFRPARITNRGIEVVERHLRRFIIRSRPDRANTIMVDRLRRITQGALAPTDWDLRFYTHELREFVRYRN